MVKEDTGRGVITLDNGELARAAFPVIVSASRRTDIPAFYADWFFGRMKKGYSAWINPFNGRKYYIGYDDTKFIVFWSKNPELLLPYLDYLEFRGIGCYIHFTLNDYGKEGLEPGVPLLEQRISTFRLLALKLGREAVIWRYDPLLLTDYMGIDSLLAKIRRIGGQLHNYTRKLVFSFADISPYKKVKRNLEKSKIPYREWTMPEMREFAQKLVEMNKSEGWNLQLAACGETVDLPGIDVNKCVDDALILRLAPQSTELLNFLGARLHAPDLLDTMPPGAIAMDGGTYFTINKNNRHKGQRAQCACIKSVDAGTYNTCPHLCVYCYANASPSIVLRNYAIHGKNPQQDTITGL